MPHLLQEQHLPLGDRLLRNQTIEVDAARESFRFEPRLVDARREPFVDEHLDRTTEEVVDRKMHLRGFHDLKLDRGRGVERVRVVLVELEGLGCGNCNVVCARRRFRASESLPELTNYNFSI